jgi:hypothetical protein
VLLDGIKVRKAVFWAGTRNHLQHFTTCPPMDQSRTESQSVRLISVAFTSDGQIVATYVHLGHRMADLTGGELGLDGRYIQGFHSF